MINIKDYKLNRYKYVQGTIDKGFSIDFLRFDELIESIDRHKKTLQSLKEKRNRLSKERVPNNIGDEIKNIEEILKPLEEEYNNILIRIPNPSFKNLSTYGEVEKKYYKGFVFNINGKKFTIVSDFFIHSGKYIIEHNINEEGFEEGLLGYSYTIYQNFLDIIL